MTDKTSEMEQFIGQVNVLHSSPQVARKALCLLEDDDFDVRELVGILKSDPALTTSILKLVNSSFFGLSGQVSSLQQAVAVLGSRALRLAVLSFGLLKQLNENTPAQIYQSYWKRSLTMAAAASRIADMDGDTERDVAYCAGLLSDLGVLVFAQVRTDEYVALHERHHQSRTLLVEEENMFGFNHAELGAHMLEKWNLPSDLCEAILRHHGPPSTLWGLDFAVAASNVVATSLWTPGAQNVFVARRLLQESFQVDIDGFISFAMEVQQTVNENAELFSVSLNETIDCDTLLAIARRKFQDVAMEAALDVDSISCVLSDIPSD